MIPISCGSRSAWWNERDFQNEINKWFGHSTSGSDQGAGLSENSWGPAIDVYESKDSFLVQADLPGVNREDIEVSLEGDLLTIRGVKKEEFESKKANCIRNERASGNFSRPLILPAEADSSQVKAVYKNGVLELTLPKKEETKPKQIKVEIN